MNLKSELLFIIVTQGSTHLGCLPTTAGEKNI